MEYFLLLQVYMLCSPVRIAYMGYMGLIKRCPYYLTCELTDILMGASNLRNQKQ
jgi:hypothetical protein